MSQQTSEQARRGRPDSRAGAVDPTPGNVVLEATRHARAASALTAEGRDALALGAKRVAAWLALRTATTPPRTELEHEAVKSGLEAFLHHFDDAHRVHIASLLESAAWAQAERRVRMGLCPYGSNPSSRCDGEGRICPLEGTLTSRPECVMPHDLARYEAAAVADVGSCLSAAIDALRDVLALHTQGSQTEGAWTAFEIAAIELCLEPATCLADRLDSRRVLLILWKTVQRRRPLIAAVLRRKLSLDRRRWPGSVSTERWDV